MFPNFNRLYKAINYVRNVFPVSRWDFRYVNYDGKRCFVGACSDMLKNENKADRHGPWTIWFNMPEVIFYHLFPTTGDHYTNTYKAEMKDISKDRVCDLVQKYTDFKLRQYTKWQQYEYKMFGKSVTDKRGICI